MDIACYLYELKAAARTLNLIRRICRESNVDRIAVVFHKAIPLEGIVKSAQRFGLHSHCRYIQSAGEHWEFEAYQRGLDALSPCIHGLIVINDTAGRNYPFFTGDMRRFISAAGAAAVAGKPVIVGKVESRGCGFSLLGIHFHKWIRSNIFYINATGLTALNHTLYDERVFRAPTYQGGQLMINLPVSANLADYLLQWLNPASGKSGWLAHSARRHTGEALLRGKLGSILLEKYISARLESGGGDFVTYEPEERSFWYDYSVRMFFKRRRLLKKVGL